MSPPTPAAITPQERTTWKAKLVRPLRSWKAGDRITLKRGRIVKHEKASA